MSEDKTTPTAQDYVKVLFDAAEFIAKDDKNASILPIARAVCSGELPNDLKGRHDLIPDGTNYLEAICRIAKVDESWPDEVLDGLLCGDMFDELCAHIVEKSYNLHHKMFEMWADKWEHVSGMFEFESGTDTAAPGEM